MLRNFSKPKNIVKAISKEDLPNDEQLLLATKMIYAHDPTRTPRPRTSHPLLIPWGSRQTLGTVTRTLWPRTDVVSATSIIGLDQPSRTKHPKLLRLRRGTTSDHVPAPDVRTNHHRKQVDREISLNLPTCYNHPLATIHEHEVQEIFETHVALAPRREATPDHAEECGIKTSERCSQHHCQDRRGWTRGAQQANESDHTCRESWITETVPHGRLPRRGTRRWDITKTTTRFSS